MLVLVSCLIAVLSPVIIGRWPAGLVLQPWRWPVLIWGSLVLQVVALEVALPGAVAPVLHILTYVAAVAFVWLNRAVRGLVVVGAGAFSNGLAITLNGGTLPASQAAVDAAGFDHGMEFANTGVLEDPVLWWLGDVFAWPAPLPLANTFSIGDLLIVVGVAIAAWSGTRRIGHRAVGPEHAEGPLETR